MFLLFRFTNSSFYYLSIFDHLHKTLNILHLIVFYYNKICLYILLFSYSKLFHHHLQFWNISSNINCKGRQNKFCHWINKDFLFNQNQYFAMEQIFQLICKILLSMLWPNHLQICKNFLNFFLIIYILLDILNIIQHFYQ